MLLECRTRVRLWVFNFFAITHVLRGGLPYRFTSIDRDIRLPSTNMTSIKV